MIGSMIDRDQLTEALERWEHWTPDLPGAQGVGRDFDVVLTAARLLLDFPTDDEMVEAHRRAFDDAGGGEAGLAAGLEAVRQVMFDD